MCKFFGIIQRAPGGIARRLRARRLLESFEQNNDDFLTIPYVGLHMIGKKNSAKFKQIKHWVESKNAKRLAEKKKIRVAFVAYTTAMWSCDRLYKKLEKDGRFEPVVVVCDLASTTNSARKELHTEAVREFKKNGYKVIDANNGVDLDKIDIIFYLTPYDLVQEELNILNIPLRIMTAYVAYSFLLVAEDKFTNWPIHQLVWKFFVATSSYRKLIQETNSMGDDNVEVCGLLRMDELLDKRIKNPPEWKGEKKAKRIIYAPHHTVFGKEGAACSTFDKNYKFMLEMAKKYDKETSWIIKPHPLLRSRIVTNGFFKDESEYDQYLAEWNNLPNAMVASGGGSYFDLMKSSDSMILDSISFLAEYQYTHKPLLQLKRPAYNANDFRKNLERVLYSVPGDDYEGIEQYIKDVVIAEKDPMKKEREKFFEENLDYYKYNGNMSATDYIYNLLEKTFGEEDGKK